MLPLGRFLRIFWGYQSPFVWWGVGWGGVGFGACLPHKTVGDEPVGWLVGGREQGIWKAPKEGKWRTLAVSSGAAGKGPSGVALRAGYCTCFARLGALHRVSCASAPHLQGERPGGTFPLGNRAPWV